MNWIIGVRYKDSEGKDWRIISLEEPIYFQCESENGIVKSFYWKTGTMVMDDLVSGEPIYLVQMIREKNV